MSFNKERMEVLRMVAEGKISAEEGARLLEALTSGTSRYPKKDPPKDKSDAPPFEPFDLGNLFGEIGRAIHDTVLDTVGAVSDVFEQPAADYEGVEELELELEEGTVLTIKPLSAPSRGRRGRRAHCRPRYGWGDRYVNEELGDVIVSASPDSIFRATGEGLSLAGEGDQRTLLWGGDDLTLQLPASVARLVVRTFNGDVTVTDAPCELEVFSLAGDVSISGQQRSTWVRNTRGDVRLDSLEITEGELTIETYGGDVRLGCGDRLSATLDISTMGGAISIRDDLAADRKKPTWPGSTAKITVGEGTAAATIKTMGGDVQIV